MYRNRKFNRNAKSASGNKEENDNKRAALNPIDENATIKISRTANNLNNDPGANGAEEGGGDGILDNVVSSEENIPASQEPTQRYLSQRSIITSTLTRTQSKNVTYRPPVNYFELVLMKSGVQLDEGDNFILSCDHITFVNKFREIFVKCPNYPENIEMFTTGLRDAFSGKSKYKLKLLSGCTINAMGEESVYQSQESMIVNLLMIDFLRDHVLGVLLETIKETACKDAMIRSSSNLPLLPLMLSQLRYVATTHSKLIAERIKEIFKNANEQSRWDLIASAEFILDSTYHDEFVQMLLDNLPEDKNIFNNVTIQAFINLNLSMRMQEKLRRRVVEFIKDHQCPNNILPVLVKFLFKALTDANDECLRELVKTMRDILIQRILSSTEKQIQLELFKIIEQGLVRSRNLYSIWQKVIATLPIMKFKSPDFVILLLLVHIKEDNFMYVENILRRRIRQQDLTVELLNEVKTRFGFILEQHTNTLMQILHDFLKEKHKIVADFAKASYGILFEICDSTQKLVVRKLLQLTCDKSTQNLTNIALELLKDLQRKYPQEIQNWGMLLMPLLDRLNDVSLSQTRLIMSLLCSIAFPAPSLSECPMLQDQIDMIIKKQMISRSDFVKKQGIIGSVQLIDNMARIDDYTFNGEDLNVTYNTTSELPDGRGKMAANFILLIDSATMHCPESLALFYDELASICSASSHDRSNTKLLDRSFVIWLCDLMTFYFQNSYVIEHSPETTFGIRLSYQKCINSVADTNTEESELPSIAVNLSELVLKPAAKASSSILVLAPLFNLVRVLHLQRNLGSLEQINALLGCALILPTFFDDPNIDGIFYDYDENVQKKILDIYFHCVNWIRETVSSFATQSEKMIRKKVLQRLTELIEIEAKISKLLSKAPADYMPPKCQFTDSCKVVVQQMKSGRGRPSSSANANQSKNVTNQNGHDTLLLNDTNVNSTNIGGDLTISKLAGFGKSKSSNLKRNFDVMYGPKEIYRQMDSDIMLILQEELDIKYPLGSESVGKKIGLLEFRFIMTDLVCKLESITGIQKFQSEQPLQYIAKPRYFINDLSKFLEMISKNIKTLSDAINKQLDNVKRLYSDAELFTDEFNLLKVCYGLCLRLLAAFFSWSGFTDGPTELNLLKDSFTALLDRSKINEWRRKMPQALAHEVFNKFLKYETSIADLKTAVCLYDLLVTLNRFSTSKEANVDALNSEVKELRNLCNTFLRRKWYNYEGTLEKGAACNLHLDTLVKGFLKNADFRRQNHILQILLVECKQIGGKDSTLKSFPNFKKTNFPLVFRGLCEVLISTLSDLIFTSDEYTNDRMKIWEKSCELFNLLLEIVKSLDVPRNFQLFLKYSHMYLKLLLQHGLESFEQNLRQNPERVSEFLKSLQITTRFLHNLCCHSKALKNTAIISQIPALRETVETLVFRVKALMTANKCASVFSMGNLKNKDLHGDEILSQTTTLSGDQNENSEEELPEDDVSVDETVLGQDVTGNSRTVNSKRSCRSKSSSLSKCF